MTLQPRFNAAIVSVRRAESSGATSGELSELVALLNTALDLNRQALKLNAPYQAEQRAELLGQVNQLLTTVTNRADELAVTSSQRMYANTVITYVGGAMFAVLGTIAYALAVRVYRNYRIKMTFQMKVSRK